MNDDNRYKPPQSPLADPAPPALIAPVTVRNACWLILIAMGLGYLTLLPGIGPDDAEPMSGAELIGNAVWIAFFTGLTVWLTIKIRQRRDWARWITGMLTLLGWLLLAAAWDTIAGRSTAVAAISIVATALEAWAMLLLFTGTGARWFATRR